MILFEKRNGKACFFTDIFTCGHDTIPNKITVHNHKPNIEM